MSRQRDRNYGAVHGITVDDCPRCHNANVKGIRLVRPDGTGALPTLVELCSSCGLELAEDIASMVALQIRDGIVP